MIYRVELHPKALLELEEVYEWYEARKEGLGRRFIDVMNSSIHAVIQHPERYPKKKGNYRKCLLKFSHIRSFMKY